MRSLFCTRNDVPEMGMVRFLAFLGCVSIAVCSCPPNLFKSSINNVCCEYCPAGSFMKKECEGSLKPTQCEPCPGNSFTSKPNNDNLCKSCRKECGSGQVLKANCTNTADSLCHCPPGKFWNNLLLQCLHCTKCNPGQQMTVECQEEKDRVCETCEKGTYLKDNKCMPCSYCRQGEVVVEECTAARDTECRKAGLPQPTKVCRCQCKKSRTTQTTWHSTKPSTVTERDNPSDLPQVAEKVDVLGPTVWILIFTIVVLIVVVVFLVVWLCKGRRKYSVCEHQGKKDAISTDIAESAVKENHVMFRTVTADIVEKLGHMLNSNSGKNWKHLAGKMGYSSTDTQAWNVVPNEAAQKLLHDWSTRNGSTVYALYQMLKELRRDDAAALILPLLVDQRVEGETV